MLKVENGFLKGYKAIREWKMENGKWKMENGFKAV